MMLFRLLLVDLCSVIGQEMRFFTEKFHVKHFGSTPTPPMAGWLFPGRFHVEQCSSKLRRGECPGLRSLRPAA